MRVAQGDHHGRLGGIKKVADIEEFSELCEGKDGRGDGVPDFRLENGVGGEVFFEGGEGAFDGLFAGDVRLAGFRRGFLFDNEIVLLLGGLLFCCGF